MREPSSKLDIANVSCHAAFRFVEQALKSKAGFSSQLERCMVLGCDSQDHLTSFCYCSQISFHEIYSSYGQTLSSPLRKNAIRNIDLAWPDKPRHVHFNEADQSSARAVKYSKGASGPPDAPALLVISDERFHGGWCAPSAVNPPCHLFIFSSKVVGCILHGLRSQKNYSIRQSWECHADSSSTDFLTRTVLLQSPIYIQEHRDRRLIYTDLLPADKL